MKFNEKKSKSFDKCQKERSDFKSVRTYLSRVKAPSLKSFEP